jgi:hypothetical protein
MVFTVGCSSLTATFEDVSEVDEKITSGELKGVVLSADLDAEELLTVSMAGVAYSNIRAKWEDKIHEGNIGSVFINSADLQEDYSTLQYHYNEVTAVIMANLSEYSAEDKEYLSDTSKQFKTLDEAFTKAEVLNNIQETVKVVIKAATIAAAML